MTRLNLLALVSSVVLTIGFLWSLLAFGEWTHQVLLAHPALGVWRVGLWFAAFVGYALLGVVVVGGVLVLASL